MKMQPDPIPNDEPSIHDIVIKEAKDPLLALGLNARKRKGLQTYNTLLQVNNGRDPLWDAIEEGLDMIVYLKQYLIEKKNPFTTQLIYKLVMNLVKVLMYIHRNNYKKDG